jgi:hypothetical protein
MLQRRAVEQQRVPRTPEQRRRLVEDPRWNTRRRPLGALARPGDLQRLELEARDLAQRQRHGDLERAGRAEPGALREICVDAPAQPDGRPAERSQLLIDGGRERRAQLEAVGGLERERDPELDRDREGEPAAVVGVLADQVHAPGRMHARPHPSGR